MARVSNEHTSADKGVNMVNVTKQGYLFTVNWSKEDQKYLCAVDRLSGCMSDGITEEEAVNNLERIVDEWLETALELGRKIPKP